MLFVGNLINCLFRFTCKRPDLRSIMPRVFQTDACLISDFIDSFNLDKISSSSLVPSSLSKV